MFSGQKVFLRGVTSSQGDFRRVTVEVVQRTDWGGESQESRGDMVGV